MTSTPDTYNSLTSTQIRERMNRWRLAEDIGNQALLDALDHIDRLKAERSSLDQLLRGCFGTSTGEILSQAIEAGLRAEKAEAGQAQANALNAALIADMVEMQSRVKAERDKLREALRGLLDDVLDYERVNNLAPNPGVKFCWASTAIARAALEEAQ